MFRTITNRLVGRRKTIDADIDVSGAYYFLGQLDKLVKCKIQYERYSVLFELSDVAPSEIIDFVGKKLSPDDTHYTDVRHQAYEGETHTKHYLDFALGKIEARFGARTVKGKPYEFFRVIVPSMP
ncbi:MAG: hypothetical protein V1802_02080 [Candidatus Aenigmatarchaeota archaeon]